MAVSSDFAPGRGRRRALIAAASALLAGSAAGGSGVEPVAEASPESDPAAPSCLLLDEAGDPRWVADATIPDQSLALAADLNAAANAAPEVFAGTALCSDYVGMVVFVKAESAAISDQVSEIAAAYPDSPVEIRAVGASWAEMSAAAATVLDSPEYADVVSGAGPDPSNGGVSVNIIDDPWNPQGAADLVDVAALEARLGLPVAPRLVSQGGHSVFDARHTLQWLLDHPPMVPPDSSVWPRLDPSWRDTYDRAEGVEPGQTRYTPTVVETDGCLEISELGEMVHDGDGGSAAAQQLAHQLSALADASPDVFTGVAFCSHYEGVVVFVKAATEQVADQVAAIASAYPDYPVTVKAVGASMSQLLAATRTVMAWPELKDVITGAGPDIRIGAVAIDVALEDSGQEPGDLVDAAALEAELGLPVRLRVGSRGVTSQE